MGEPVGVGGELVAARGRAEPPHDAVQLQVEPVVLRHSHTADRVGSHSGQLAEGAVLQPQDPVGDLLQSGIVARGGADHPAARSGVAAPDAHRRVASEASPRRCAPMSRPACCRSTLSPASRVVRFTIDDILRAVVAQSLDCHQSIARRAVAEAGGAWSRYASATTNRNDHPGGGRGLRDHRSHDHPRLGGYRLTRLRLRPACSSPVCR